RDGTQVTLAPQSRLRYPADYGAARRELYLDGEAYFQVTPDSQRPLRVHTAASVTEDLGTAFAIRAYADQVATEVVVAQGRVALGRADTTTPSRAPALVLGLGTWAGSTRAGSPRSAAASMWVGISRGPGACSPSTAHRSARWCAPWSGGTTSKSAWPIVPSPRAGSRRLSRTNQSIWCCNGLP